MSAFFLTGICKRLFMGFLLMHSTFEKAKSTTFRKNSAFLRKEEAARRREDELGRPCVKYLQSGPEEPATRLPPSRWETRMLFLALD